MSLGSTLIPPVVAKPKRLNSPTLDNTLVGGKALSDDELSQLTIVDESPALSDAELSQLTFVDEPPPLTDVDLAGLTFVDEEVSVEAPPLSQERLPVDIPIDSRTPQRLPVPPTTQQQALANQLEREQPTQQFVGKTIRESAKAVAHNTLKLAEWAGGAGVEAVGQAGASLVSSARDQIFMEMGGDPTKVEDLPQFDNPFEGQREHARRAFKWGSLMTGMDEKLATSTYMGLLSEGDLPTAAQKLIVETFGVAPSMGAAILGHVTGGLAGVALTAGSIEGAAKYDQMLREGKAPREALIKSGIYGLSAALLNMVPFAKVLQKYLPKNAAGTTMAIGMNMLTEGVTEVADR